MYWQKRFDRTNSDEELEAKIKEIHSENKNYGYRRVHRQLRNKRYMGDTMLQKTFTVDFITKKKKINEGEVQQYYIENSHPAIIPPETFELVRIEIERRKGHRKSTAGIFASKLICGECGSYYGSKVWHSNDKYRRVIMQCNHKFKNKKRCSTPHFDEETLKKIFIEVFNSTLDDRDELLQNLAEILSRLTDTTAIDSEIERERDLLQAAKRQETLNIIRTLKENNTAITEFDESLFHSLVDSITVQNDKTEPTPKS